MQVRKLLGSPPWLDEWKKPRRVFLGTEMAMCKDVRRVSCTSPRRPRAYQQFPSGRCKPPVSLCTFDYIVVTPRLGKVDETQFRNPTFCKFKLGRHSKLRQSTYDLDGAPLLLGAVAVQVYKNGGARSFWGDPLHRCADAEAPHLGMATTSGSRDKYSAAAAAGLQGDRRLQAVAVVLES